jgi:hypothetical protein
MRSTRCRDCHDDRVPASFTADLCGYRGDTENPNTSDNNDGQSIRLGRALFAEIGVPDGSTGPQDPGSLLETEVEADLRRLRPDLLISNPGSAPDFEQYEHLAVFKTFKQAMSASPADAASVIDALQALPPSRARASALQKARALAGRLDKQQDAVSALLRDSPEESLLKIDLTVSSPGPGRKPRLEVALSAKWSLRTDRAQDCVSQGAKLVAQRRGRMPHFAVITMEPRPAMLRILADGSGAVDCVYHLDLAGLERAIRAEAGRARGRKWPPLETFERLLAQRRLRDYDELLAEVGRV